MAARWGARGKGAGGVVLAHQNNIPNKPPRPPARCTGVWRG